MISDSLSRQGDWLFRWRSYVLLGFAPLFLVVMTQPEFFETNFGPAADSLYEAICIVIAFVGLAIRVATVGFVPAGTSGRNTTGQVASTLNTTGLYSLTRNPLYLGNAVTIMGITLFAQDIYLALLMLMFLIVYLERIIAAEERFLSATFGSQYTDWTAAVPAFFPRLSGWRPPTLPFSMRSVLRREYSTLFAIVSILFAMDQSREFLAEHSRAVDPAWLTGLTLSAAAYLSLRWLKKRTRMLSVDGR